LTGIASFFSVIGLVAVMVHNLSVEVEGHDFCW
jgi:hypothetical protein